MCCSCRGRCVSVHRRAATQSAPAGFLSKPRAAERSKFRDASQIPSSLFFYTTKPCLNFLNSLFHFQFSIHFILTKLSFYKVSFRLSVLPSALHHLNPTDQIKTLHPKKSEHFSELVNHILEFANQIPVPHFSTDGKLL